MSTPYGYKVVDGKLVPDGYKAKVVKLSFVLGELGLDGEDVKNTFNIYGVPKSETDGYDIDAEWNNILERGKQVLEERLLLQKLREEEEE